MLPRLVLIANGFTDPGVAERAITACAAGVPWIHLRDHEASALAFREAVTSLAPQLRAAGTRVTVNTRLDVARDLDADLHVGTRGPSVAAARTVLAPEAVIGFSAHDPAELDEPANAGADYFFLSPIYPTDSKPGHPGSGLDALRRATAATDRPVYALGGVTPECVAPCLHAGAHGTAVLSGILHTDDPAEATRHYVQALDHANSKTENLK